MTTTSQPDSPGKVLIFGRIGTPLGYMIRDFLHRCDIPFEWVELTGDEDARARAGVCGLQDNRLPVCVFPDGTRLDCPTIRQITEPKHPTQLICEAAANRFECAGADDRSRAGGDQVLQGRV